MWPEPVWIGGGLLFAQLPLQSRQPGGLGGCASGWLLGLVGWQFSLCLVRSTVVVGALVFGRVVLVGGGVSSGVGGAVWAGTLSEPAVRRRSTINARGLGVGLRRFVEAGAGLPSLVWTEGLPEAAPFSGAHFTARVTAVGGGVWGPGGSGGGVGSSGGGVRWGGAGPSVSTAGEDISTAVMRRVTRSPGGWLGS